MLQLLGHHTGTAHDGPSALRLAKSAPFDLVLLDIGLPGMDGYEVAAAMRKERVGGVLVAVTGYARGEHVRRAQKARFDRHLLKPVDLETLETLMQEVAR